MAASIFPRLLFERDDENGRVRIVERRPGVITVDTRKMLRWPVPIKE